MTEKIIKWVSCGRDNLNLRAEPAHEPDYSNPGFHMGLHEAEMDEIQVWCWETGIGRRMSFDTWQFNSTSDITAFLLKWS